MDRDDFSALAASMRQFGAGVPGGAEGLSPALNLLVLNFCYHNAHHVKPTLPWYKLPALHRELYGDEYQRTLAFSDQLRSYHRHRLAGIHAETYGQVPAHQAMREGRAVPVYGLSFLTAF